MTDLWVVKDCMRILAYDIESTTGSHSDGSMCSFGYCIADENFNIIEQKDLVMCPCTKRFSIHIPLRYSKEYILKQPNFTYFYEEIKWLFESCDLVIGFSVMNDVDFLNDVCSVFNLKKIKYSFYDVQLLYKKLKKMPTLISLEKAMVELGEEYLPHRSDEDARATLLLFKHLCKSQNLSVKEFISRQFISEGYNGNNQIIPCSDGSLTKKEKTKLINSFRDKVCRKVRNKKGVFEGKSFSFSEEIRCEDINFFRNLIYKVYKQGGKYVPIGVSNYFVIKSEIKEKEKNELAKRNEEAEKTKIITLDELLKDVKSLPSLDFSKDRQILIKIKKEQQSKNNKRG